MKVAPLAMVRAVRPPYLLKVLLHISAKLADGERLVVCACFLKTTISTGVRKAAIMKLDARLAISMLTN